MASVTQAWQWLILPATYPGHTSAPVPGESEVLGSTPALLELLCVGDSSVWFLFESRAACPWSSCSLPVTRLHNSHERGLIYSQEIQTLDTASKGPCLYMKRGIILNIHFPPLWDLKPIPQRPCFSVHLDSTQRIQREEGRLLPGYPMLTADTSPGFSVKGRSWSLFIIENFISESFAIFSCRLKPLLHPSSCDHLC